MTVDVVASANIKDTLPVGVADGAVNKVLLHKPVLLGLQEWSRGAPACIDGTVYRYVRSSGGGGPVIYNANRFELLNTRTKVLAGAGFVGKLPGRRSTLSESRAAVYVFADELGMEDVALVNIHLTAEVQKGKGYLHDLAHRLRVARHKLERLHLRLLVRRLSRRHRVYVVGDTNYDGMSLKPLTSCWENWPKAEATGTLGHRSVDYVFAPDHPLAAPRQVSTASDHDAIVVTYFRRKS